MDKKALKVYKSYFPHTHRFYFPERIKPVYVRRKIVGRTALKECVEVEITGKEYARCAGTENITGEDRYTMGVANSEDDKNKVERTGSFGEMAFAKVTGLPMSVHKGSFPFDCVVLENKRGDVKNCTPSTYHKYGCNFIKIWGRNYVLKSNIYISSFTEEDNLKDYAKIVLAGYMEKTTLDKFDPVPAPGGKWLNKEMYFKDTKSIRSLINGSKHIASSGGKLYLV